MRFRLVRFNSQQDLMFVRLDSEKNESVPEAVLQQAAGGVWVGEYLHEDDDLKALVFVNAMPGRLKRDEVVSALNRAVSKVARTLEAQLPD